MTILREDELQAVEDDHIDCCVDLNGERIDVEEFDPDLLPELAS